MALSFTIEVDDKGSPKIRGLKKNLDDTKKVSDKLSKGLKIAAGAIAAAGTAAAAGAATVFTMTKKFAESQDAVGKFAEKIGFSVEGLSSFRFAAESSGVSADKAQVALQRFTRRLDEARAGGGAAKSALEDMEKILGKDIINSGKNAEQLMGDIADAIQKVEDPSKRVSLAFKLFDSEGVGLINTLKGGSKALEDAQKKAIALGAAFDEDAAKKSANFNDALLDVESTIGGIFRDTANEVMPEITKIMEDFRDIVLENRDSFKDFGKGVIDSIGTVLPLLEATGKQISLVFKTISDNIAQIEAQNSVRINNTKADLIEAFRIQFDLNARIQDDQQDLTKLERERLANVNKFISAQIKSGDFTNEEVRLLKIRGERLLLVNILQEEGNNLSQEEVDLIQERIDKITSETQGINQKIQAQKESGDKTKKNNADLIKQQNEVLEKSKEEEKRLKKEAETKVKVTSKIKDILGKFNKDMNDLSEESFQKAVEREKEYLELKKDTQKQIEFENLSSFDQQINMIEEEYNARVEMLGRTEALEINFANKINEIKRQKRMEDLQDFQNNLNIATQFTSAASSTFNAIRDAEQNRINNRFEERRELIEEEFESRIKGAANNAKKQEQLRKSRDERLRQLDLKRDKEIEASNKRTANIRKTIAIAEATINGAVAITKVLSQGGIFAAPLTVLTAAQTAAQIGLIASQKFEAGGFPQGKNAIIQVNEAGQESVLNAQATRFLGRDGVDALNNGRTDQILNLIAENTGASNSGSTTININGGVVDKFFVETQLIPILKQVEARR